MNERAFGVEIEFLGGDYYQWEPRAPALGFEATAKVKAAMRAQGLTCRVEPYNHTTRSWWKLIMDYGVGRGAGLELVSAILRGEDGRRHVEAASRALKAAEVGVDDTCELHIHHDIRDLDVSAFRRLMHGWADAQEATDQFVAPRERNQPYNDRDDRFNWCQRLTDEDLAKVDTLPTMSRRIAGQHLKGDRDRVLNVQAYALYGTVECRQHEGTIEAGDIISWVDFGQAFIEAAVNGAMAPATSDPEELLAFLSEQGGLSEPSAVHLLDRVERFNGAVDVLESRKLEMR